MEENVNFDNEILAYLSVRKDELIDSHKTYIHNHPEIREVLNDFLSALLLHKPNDVFVFAKEYYHPFNPTPLKYKPLIVVGPSGVGKGTLISKVTEKYSSLFEKKISYTTRPKKAYEKSIGNYQFISKEEFMRRVEKNEFIEWCNVHGHLYGTTFAELERIKAKGKIPIIEVDVQGAIRINEKALEGNFLFIYPPSFEELRRRLGSRLETEEDFKKRIQAAIKEIETANNSVLFTNRLVNDDLESAVDQFYTLIEALYFQEIKNLQGDSQEKEKEKMADNQKSYFSALARGGLSAALTYQQQSQDMSRQQYRQGGYDSEDNINHQYYNQNVNNKKENSQKYQLPPQPNRENRNKTSNHKINKENAVSEEEKTRLRNLMDGNDLHTLQEEISKEEDDSTFLIKVDPGQSSKSIRRINMKNSLSSIDSCNYQTKMEEGYVQYEVSNNSSLKIFDSQFQNSSQEPSLQHRSNSLHNAKEMQENEAKKQLAKQLLDGMRRENEVLQQQNMNAPVEQRLFEYQKKAQEKIQMMRLEKEEQEVLALRPAPIISQKSDQMARRRSQQNSSHSPDASQQTQNSLSNYAPNADYYNDLKKKEEARQKVQEQQEMVGFTGKPEINKKSKHINRKLDDLMDWKQTQMLKREHELQRKLLQENQEIEKLQNTKKVSKASQKILEGKYGNQRMGERVEDRLMREATMRQKRVQIEFQASEINNEKKVTRNRSRSTKNCNKKSAGKSRHNKVFSFQGSLSQQNSQKNFAPVLSERYNSHEKNAPQQNQLTFQQSKQSIEIQSSQDAEKFNSGFGSFTPTDQYNNTITPTKSLDYKQPAYSEQSPISNDNKATSHPSIPNIFQDYSGLSKSYKPDDFSPFSQAALSSYQSGQDQNKLSFPLTTAQHQQFQIPQYQNQQQQLSSSQKFQSLNQQFSVNQIQPSQPILFQKYSTSNTQSTNETPKAQPKNKKKSQNSFNQQKKTVQYESLFHKVQKMNTVNTSQGGTQNQNYTQNTPDDKSSNSCSIQFASAKGTFNFPYTNQQEALKPGASIISSNSCEINPIYLSIQQEKMRMDGGVFNYQPQFYQPKNYEFSAGKSANTDFSHSIDIPHQIQYTDQSQAFSNHAPMNGRLTYPSSGVSTAMKNPQYSEPLQQDAIINKILENSYIPNGNGKDTRKQQHMNADLQKMSTLQFPPFQVMDQNYLSERNHYHTLSDQKLHHFKSSEDTLYKPDGSKETQASNRPCSENRKQPNSSPKKPQNFYDRNNVWLQKKQNKIEIAKNIKDKKEENQCTFKPKIQVKQGGHCTKKGGSKDSASGSINTKKVKSPTRWFQNVIKETKEEGVQVNVYGKSPQKKQSEQNNKGDISGHTTRNLNQAIEMMNFEDADKYMKSTRKGLQTSRSLSDQCDISCLSPEKNNDGKVDDDCSNFESASFMSVGREQASLFQNKQRLIEPVKFMTKKNMQF